jgi:hypothetical protein
MNIIGSRYSKLGLLSASLFYSCMLFYEAGYYTYYLFSLDVNDITRQF